MRIEKERIMRKNKIQAMIADMAFSDEAADRVAADSTSDASEARPGGSTSALSNSASSKTSRPSPLDVAAAEAEAAAKRAQDKKNAETLDNQWKVAVMLFNYWSTLEWPEIDKTADQLPDDYCPPAADTTAFHCKESKVDSKTGSKRSSSHVADEPMAKVRRSGRLASAHGSRGSGLP